MGVVREVASVQTENDKPLVVRNTIHNIREKKIDIIFYRNVTSAIVANTDLGRIGDCAKTTGRWTFTRLSQKIGIWYMVSPM